SPFANCRSYRVWDVVILEVEKDAPSRTYEFVDNRRPFGSVELHADLIRMSRVTDGRHDLPGGLGRRYIQGNDQTLARVHFLHRVFEPCSRTLFSNFRGSTLVARVYR